LDRSIIVADAGPLIALGCLNLLPILTHTLGSIIIPNLVADECTQDKSLPGAHVIQAAIENHDITVYTTPSTEELIQLSSVLDAGEAAAIALAIELESRILVDEKLARRAAKQHNLQVIGTAGVLLLAKQKQLIPAVLPIIQQLKKVGYYLSNALISEVARMAGEKSAL
jgi:predicted nucleic acid-binding protein